MASVWSRPPGPPSVPGVFCHTFDNAWKITAHYTKLSWSTWGQLQLKHWRNSINWECSFYWGLGDPPPNSYYAGLVLKSTVPWSIFQPFQPNHDIPRFLLLHWQCVLCPGWLELLRWAPVERPSISTLGAWWGGVRWFVFKRKNFKNPLFVNKTLLPLI